MIITKSIKQVQISLDIDYKDYLKDRSVRDYFSIDEINQWRRDLVYSEFIQFSNEELIDELKQGFSDNFYENVAKEILIERNFNLENLLFL